MGEYLFRAHMIEEDINVKVYAVDTSHDAFLIDYHGRFRWFRRDEFRPITIKDELIAIRDLHEAEELERLRIKPALMEGI